MQRRLHQVILAVNSAISSFHQRFKLSLALLIKSQCPLRLFSHRVQFLIDVLGNRLDLSGQVVLDLEHVVLIVFGNKVDGETKVTESARTPNPVEVGVGGAWEVEVDDDVHRHDVDASREEVSTHKASSLSIAEVMVNSRKFEELVRRSNTETYLLRSFCCIREWMKKHE